MILQFHANAKNVYKKELYKELRLKRGRKEHVNAILKKLKNSDYLIF